MLTTNYLLLFTIEKFRWPYRDDAVFSLLSFIVLVVPLALSVFTNENFETIKLVVWLVVFGFALLAWVFKKKQDATAAKAGEKRSAVFRLSLLQWLMTGIVLWALLSALLAPDKLYSFFGFYYRFTNGFLFLSLWSLTVLLLADSLEGDRQKWIFLLKILCADALLVAAKSILESMGLTLYQGPGESADLFLRSSPSFLGNPNFSAMFMAGLLPFFLVFWRQAQTFLSKLYYSLGALVVVIGLAILASRGSLLALGAGIVAGVALLAFAPGFRHWLVRAGIIVAAAVVLIAALMFTSRPGAFHLTTADPNVGLRLKVWEQSWHGILAHPLVGVGIGNFALFQERLPRPANMGVFDDPHNLWILLAVSGGLPLLVLFLGVVFAAGFGAWRKFRADFDWLWAATICSLVIFLIAAAFTPVSIPCFLLLAVLAALPADGLCPAGTVSIKPAARWLLGAAAVLFVGLGALLLVGETTLWAGYGDFVDNNNQSALRMLAFSKIANPTNVLTYSFLVRDEVELGQNPQKTAADIRTMERLHPQQANTYVLSANAYFALLEKTHNPAYLDLAIAAMSHSLQIDPAYPGRYGELGFYYYFKKDYNTAMADLQHSLSLDQAQVSPLVLEARIYQLRNDRGNMLKALEDANKLQPANQQIEYLLLIAKHEPDINAVPFNIIYSQQ